MLHIGNAPVSWAVFTADADTNPPWAAVLDDISSSGYSWLELGPIGFLPEDPTVIAPELERRGLRVSGTFLYEEMQELQARAHVLERAHRVCELLQVLGGRYFVVIQAMTQDRMLTAGRSEAAERLDAGRWRTLVETVEAVSALARDRYGLTPVFHPHAGTYVEFRDEVDRLLADTDADVVDLCIDTGHSAYAGIDPVDLLRASRARAAYLHLKDIDGSTLARVADEGLDFDRAVAAGIFCPLGRGVVDFEALKEELDRAGTIGWATVEQDVDPHEPVDPKTAAAASLEYLRRIGLARESE
jgi:inosose dehydratase